MPGELTLRRTGCADTNWERFVRRHLDYTVFHGRGWLEAVETVFGYEPRHALLHESGDEDPVAAVPGFSVRRLPGESVVNPFFEYGYPLISEQVDPGSVLETLTEEVGPFGAHVLKDARWSRIEKSFYPSARYGAVLPGTTVRTPVTRPYSEIRSRAFDADVRRALDETPNGRRRIETGSIDEFYPLYLDTMRRHGSPPFPVEFFDTLQASLEVLLARVDGAPEAAVLLLGWDETTLVWSNTSRQEYWSDGVNQRLYASAIERACRSGRSIVDFGRSRPGSGVERFKRGFENQVRSLVSCLAPPHRARHASLSGSRRSNRPRSGSRRSSPIRWSALRSSGSSMNNRILAGTLGCLGLLGAYWCRRTNAASTAMAVSRTIAVDEDARPAKAAAVRLDVDVRSLPQRFEKLDAKVRRLQGEKEDVRRRWANAVWNALTPLDPDRDSPQFVTVSLPDGDTADVQALAERAVDDDHGVTVVVGESSFAVVVDEHASRECSAAAIAVELAAPDAGAGSGEQFALGANPNLDADDDRIVRAVNGRWPVR